MKHKVQTFDHSYIIIKKDKTFVQKLHIQASSNRRYREYALLQLRLGSKPELQGRVYFHRNSSLVALVSVYHPVMVANPRSELMIKTQKEKSELLCERSDEEKECYRKTSDFSCVVIRRLELVFCPLSRQTQKNSDHDDNREITGEVSSVSKQQR